MAEPATVQVPWYRPSRIVWQLPWLGLAFALATIFGIIVARSILASGPMSEGAFIAFSGVYGLGFAWGILPNILYLAAIAMAIASAVLLIRSATRADDRVALLYKSLPRNRRYLNIALWFSLVAVMVFQFMPFFAVNQDWRVLISINTRYTLLVLDWTAGFVIWLNGIFTGSWFAELIYFIVPITISSTAALALSYALFMFLFMTTLRPNSALLLKRIFYAFALALATVVPFGIAPTAIWQPDADFSFALSQTALFNLLAPGFLLLAVSLAWLYFQKARLAGLGARVKARVRLIALGGAALQVFYLVSWAVFAAPNLSSATEFFYVGSVLLAAFVAVAWFGLLLMVGARRKWDWALFGLIGATQIASLIVVYPGLLTA